MGNDKTGSRDEVGPRGPLPGAKPKGSKVGATPASAAKAHKPAKKGTADGRIGDTPVDTFDDNQPGSPNRESVGVPDATSDPN